MDWILAILGDFFPASQLQGDTAEHAEYISSVLVEESLKGSLKREILTEFLSDLVTIDDAQIKGKQLDSVVSQLLSDYASLSISLAQLDLEKDPEPLQGPKKKVISAESSDKALKERLLAQYAFDFDEIVELEDGQLEIITRSEPRTVSGSRSNSDILDGMHAHCYNTIVSFKSLTHV